MSCPNCFGVFEDVICSQYTPQNTYKYVVIREFPDSELVVGFCNSADEAFDEIDNFYKLNHGINIKYSVRRLRVTE